MEVQTIRTETGDELVVIARRDYEELRAARLPDGSVVLSERDYDALRARAGEETAEDAMADRLAQEARRRRERDGDQALPAWLSGAILAGEHPIRAARKHMGLTQADLAQRAHIGQAHLSEVESGKKRLGGAALAAVAGVLAVNPAWLED